MLDMHSHILPSIDDGAISIAEALEMLRIAEKEGTSRIIATPHYRRGYYENQFETVLKHIEKIKKLSNEKGIKMEILPGQEIFLDSYITKDIKEGYIKGLNHSRYMLIELSMNEMPAQCLEFLYEVRVLGFIPIIAHPERYVYINEKPSLLNEFINEGCLFQLNAGSITGVFGKKTKNTAKILIQHGLCSFIASDAHSIHRRKPGLKEAIHIGSSIQPLLAEILKSNWRLLLNDEEIGQSGNKIKARKRFFRLLSIFTK